MANGTTLQSALLDRVEALHGKFDAFREEYLREHAIVLNETRRAHDRINTVETNLTEITRKVGEIEKLMPWVRAMAFLVAALSVPIILAAVAFIWQIITHQAIVP